jgi:hypothetical protein
VDGIWRPYEDGRDQAARDMANGHALYNPLRAQQIGSRAVRERATALGWERPFISAARREWYRGYRQEYEAEDKRARGGEA